MNNNFNDLELRFNVTFEYNENGKKLEQIIKDHFLIYLKEENEKINKKL